MYKTLSPHAIGVTPRELPQALQYAKVGGFDGLEVNVAQIADLVEKQGSTAVKKMFADSAIRPAVFGLPVEWRRDEESYRADLAKLPRYAKAASAIGATRCATWVMPCSNERDPAENRKFHIARFKPIAQTLDEFGVRLGLEFIGPRTLRESQKFPFIHTMSEMLDLGREIGPNVGLLLDCWHWYTSHATVQEVKNLCAEQVVYVHVNDAPRGVAIDEQIDSVRDLPGATGVIDIAGFLQALKQIGYDGPVTPEPFKKELGDLPSDEARLKTVGAAMDRIFAQSGLG